jgi:hypothetical protein
LSSPASGDNPDILLRFSAPCGPLVTQEIVHMRKSLFMAISIVTFVASAPALASVVNCGTTAFSELAASACLGSFKGNINGSASELDTLAARWHETFAYAGKSDDDDAGPFTSSPNGKQHVTLTFDHALVGDFVIGLKAADWYSYYLFSADTPVGSLTFNTTAGVSTNKWGQAQDLSHAALYLAKAATTSSVTNVPEPETGALLLASLALMAGIARRRRQG